jgi:hypothetical protein
MRLLHYTQTPLEFDPDRTYTQPDPSDFAKPVGLWVSVEGEDDWPSWCRAEDYCPERLACAQQVTLNPDADILHISSGVELEAFHDEWSVPGLLGHARGALSDGRPGLPAKAFWAIDWPRLAEKYDGIIIAPYLYSHRLSTLTNWYYGWDAASGCIWNLAAIDAVEPA